MKKICLGIILPCYNESAILSDTFTEIIKCLQDLIDKKKITANSFAYFVDDGSADKTWLLIENQHIKSQKLIKGLKLTNNVGHQKALLAGMLNIKDKVDCIITIDADLQDDLTIIEKMIDEYVKGYEIVYGVKENRSVDSFFKKVTAFIYYKMMKLLGVDIITNHADFRLCSKHVLTELSKFSENNLFLRVIFPSLGFNSKKIYYTLRQRHNRASKYSLFKMLTLAWNSIISFTIKPLRIISVIGFITFFFSTIMGLYALYMTIISDKTVPGWASTVIPMYFLGGIQLLSLGVLGEYIGKTHQEVKKRPQYIIEKELI